MEFVEEDPSDCIFRDATFELWERTERRDIIGLFVDDDSREVLVFLITWR